MVDSCHMHSNIMDSEMYFFFCYLRPIANHSGGNLHVRNVLVPFTLVLFSIQTAAESPVRRTCYDQLVKIITSKSKGESMQ